MPSLKSVKLRQINELQTLLRSLEGIASSAQKDEAVKGIQDAMISLSETLISKEELTRLSDLTIKVIKQPETIKSQIIKLQEIKNSLSNIPSTPPVISLRQKLDAAIISLVKQPLSTTEMDNLIKLSTEVSQKIENEASPASLEAQVVLSPKYTLPTNSSRKRNKGNKKRTTRIVDIDTFEIEEQATRKAKNQWDNTYSEITEMFKLLEPAKFSDIQNFPQVKELQAELESAKRQLEPLVSNFNVDLKAAQEKNLALNPDTQKPIRVVNKFMIEAQKKTYIQYGERLNSIKERVSRIKNSLHEIKTDRQALDLNVAKTYYEQNKESLNNYKDKFSKFTTMPHYIDPIVELSYRRVEQLAKEGTKLIESTLTINNDLSTLDQLNLVIAQQKEAIMQLASFDETILLEEAGYTNYLAVSLDKKANAEQGRINALNEIDSYLKANAIPKITKLKSSGESQNNFSKELKNELTYVETIKKNIKEVNELKKTLEGINLSVISRPSSDDIAVISRVVSSDLDEYQKVINSNIGSFNNLKEKINSSLEKLTNLKNSERGRLQVILEKQNKDIEILNQQLSETESIIDLSEFEKINEKNPSLAEIYSLYNALYQQQQEKITKINQFIQSARSALVSDIRELEKSLLELKEPMSGIKNSLLEGEINTLDVNFNDLKQKYNKYSTTEIPTPEYKADLLLLQENIKEQITRKKRIESPFFKALNALDHELVKEKKRLIKKYAPQALINLDNYKDSSLEESKVSHIRNRIIQVGYNHDLKFGAAEISELESGKDVDYTSDYTISKKISDLIDPRLYLLQNLQTNIREQRNSYLNNGNLQEVSSSVEKILNDAVKPEQLARLSIEKRGFFSGFIYKLINLITPEKYKSKLMSRSERAVSTAVQDFKSKIAAQKKDACSSKNEIPLIEDLPDFPSQLLTKV